MVKGTVETALASAAARQLGLIRRRGQRLILAYHNVLARGTRPAGDRSLHLDFDFFRRQLDLLARSHSVTSLAAALDPQSPGPCIALTFDDAYAGALMNGLPEVASRELPATLFVAPGLLGNTAPWWDILASQHGGLPPDIRERCLQVHQGDSREVLERASGPTGTAPAPDTSWRIATEAELASSAELPGLTLAAHSWSHPNLTAIPVPRLQRELKEPLAWLRQHYPRQTRSWLAYPYGLFDRRVAEAADATGYTACFGISGGWHRPGVARTMIPRINVPAGLSVAGFQARINGLISYK